MRDAQPIPASVADPNQLPAGVAFATGDTVVDRTPPEAGADRPSRTRGPARWIVALATTLLMLVSSIGIAAFAQAGAAGGPTFLPAGSLAYAEARLDFPGDQREQVMAFLGHFPGFADPASFELKLDEALEQLLGGSDGPLSWQADIKPWFDGQVMIGLAGLPDLTGMSMGGAPPEVVVGLGVKDRGALDAAITKVLSSPGAPTVTTEEYSGTTIHIIANGDSEPTVFAPTDAVLLFSNGGDALKSSLDVLAGSGDSLADDPAFEEAMAALPEDRMGAFYVDAGTLRDEMAAMLQGQMSGDPPPPPLLEMILSAIPEQLSGAIRVDADHLTAQLLAVPGAGAPTLSERDTPLAAHMPAGTIAYVEARDLGPIVGQLLGLVKPMMEGQGNEDQVAQVEALLGSSLETYLDWVGDAAIGVTFDDDGPGVGIIATVTDEALAAKRLERLVTLAGLVAVLGEDPPISVSASEVGGITVTTIELTEAAGMDIGLPLEPKISVAVGDGLFLVGLGDFAADALARDAADSLASNPSYLKALEAAGTPNGGLAYIDLASALDLLEGFIPSDDQARYVADVKPYLGALDFLVAVLDDVDGSVSFKTMLFVE